MVTKSEKSPHKKMREQIDKWCADGASLKIELTPELAEALLAKNDANRKIRVSAIARYATDIASGNWVFNGEAIIIAKDGFLNNGQHRCLAVIKAGKSIETMITAGVDRSTRNTVDQGTMRQAADYLAMAGHTNASILATVISGIHQYTYHKRLDNAGRYAPTRAETIMFLDEHSIALNHALHTVGFKKDAIPFKKAIMTILYYIFRETVKNDQAVDYFFDKLLTGANLHAKHPILYVRTRILHTGKRLSNHQRAELIIRAWNFWACDDQKSVTSLPITGTELPAINLVPPAVSNPRNGFTPTWAVG